MYSLADFVPSVGDRADPPALAVVPRAPHAVAAGALRVRGEAVAVPGAADAGEAAEGVDAARVLAAVVQGGLGALVQVRHAGHRVQRAVHVQVAVADVAAAGLRRKNKNRLCSITCGIDNILELKES